jgi:DNA-binding Lrp family transcriptional regulator
MPQKIDKIDRQIINVLFQDGRESLSDIKDKVRKSDDESMSHTGIRKRITKLENSGFLKIQGNLSIKNLKYQSAFILMEMKNYDEIQLILKAYANCPRIFLMAHITGQYNLILGIVGQSMDVLQRYINYCGPTNKPGVLHSAVIYTSSLTVPEYLPLNLFSFESREHECGNNCNECNVFKDGSCLGCGNF